MGQVLGTKRVAEEKKWSSKRAVQTPACTAASMLCRKADLYSKSSEELGRRAALSSSFLVAEQQPSSDI